jgi:hypothetical protein
VAHQHQCQIVHYTSRAASIQPCQTTGIFGQITFKPPTQQNTRREIQIKRVAVCAVATPCCSERDCRTTATHFPGAVFIIRVIFGLYQPTRRTAGVPTWKVRDAELVRGGEPTVYGIRKFILRANHEWTLARVASHQSRAQNPKFMQCILVYVFYLFIIIIIIIS